MAFSIANVVLFPLFFFLLLLLLLPKPTFSQANNGNITVGASLFAGADNSSNSSSSSSSSSSSWLSSSGDFAFGFRQLENQNGLFLLCVWFAKIPDKTVVWYANKGQPSPSGSKVNLTNDQGLVLTGPQGQEMWKSETSSGLVDHAVLTDQGNFVISDINANQLWQSFNDPRDTMLPSQRIGRGLEANLLTSRHSETNFSRGRFKLHLLENGNLVLYTVNLPTEFANNPYHRVKGTQLVFNESGQLYGLTESGGTFDLATGRTVSAKEYYLRATLDFDGVFALYSHPKRFDSGDNFGWTSIWSIPENICVAIVVEAGNGVCGHNSICTLSKDKRPKCDCPKGYSLVDPKDSYGNCKPDFVQGCKEDEIGPAKGVYDVAVLMNVGWPVSDYMRLTSFSEEKCRESCLQDCLCAVAILREGTCWKKKLPLSNGRIDNSRPSVGFIKFREDNFSILPQRHVAEAKRKDRDGLVLAGAIMLGSSVFANFLLIGAICFGLFLIYKKKGKLLPREFSEMNLHRFSYAELEAATDGFREELGSGTFGTVYKGKFCEAFVAVKKLKSFVVQDGEREFKAEVKAIGKTHHKNLVRLLGYCDEKQHRLLVYEFMSNGTLATFLFGDSRPSWKQRTEIAFGIAKGLLYLHEECSNQIIHCDIKPQNILLDEYNNAKISDFGLAKLLMMDQSQTNTAIRGTKGYVAPEWFRNMPITAKVDVYSFGVVLLEIICCRRNVEIEIDGENDEGVLTDWAYDCYKEGALDALIHSEMEGPDDVKKELDRVVKVGIWCIQENPSLRPNMRKVVQMLEGVVEVYDPPSPSPFSTTG